MKAIIQIVLFLTIFISCKPNNSSESNATPSDESAEAFENLNVQTSEFSQIDSSGILIFPLRMGENSSNRDQVYKKVPDQSFWNIIFYNTMTKEGHLLTEQKILITDYDVRSLSEDGSPETIKLDFIFYRGMAKDYNNDKLLNGTDPTYLFISDKAGKNFRQISPDNCSLTGWKYIEKSRKIVLTAIKDSNNDLEFGEKDEVASFEVSLDGIDKPNELFMPLKAKLKALYDRDWKRIH